MLKMFLASSFKDVVDLFREFVDEDLNGKTLTSIPTASIPEEVVHYVHTAKKNSKSWAWFLKNLMSLQHRQKRLKKS